MISFVWGKNWTEINLYLAIIMNESRENLYFSWCKLFDHNKFYNQSTIYMSLLSFEVFLRSKELINIRRIRQMCTEMELKSLPLLEWILSLCLSLARTPDDSVCYVFGAVRKSVMVTRCVIVVNLFLLSERCLSELCNSGWCMYMDPFNQIYINNIMYFMRT